MTAVVAYWNNHNMDQVLAPMALGSLSSVAFAIGELSADTRIPLGPALAVAVSIGGMVWWLGRKLQSIEDRIESLEKDLKSRPCQINGTDCPTAEKR